MKTIVLSKRDIAANLPYEKVIDMVDKVFQEWGNGNVVMPPKINLDMSRSGFDSWSNAMPAYVASSNLGGIKWIGGYKSNPTKGLPYIMGIIILTDPETGQTMSIMDGTYISDWRTGASAAIAVKYLVNEKPKKIAMIGAGMQGKTASACINKLFPEATIAVADIAPERRRAFCDEMLEKFQIDITNAPTVKDAVADADAVVLLTTASEPIVKAEWLAEGCLTLAMGSYQQTGDKLILESDKIIVDSWEQAGHRGELKKLAESGKITRENIHTELGFIAAGKKSGRENAKERILAVLVGLGAHDIFIAGQVHKKAVEKNLGLTISLN